MALDAKSQYDLAFNITQDLTVTAICRSLAATTCTLLKLPLCWQTCTIVCWTTSLQIPHYDCPLFEDTSAQQAISIGRGPRVSNDWPGTLSKKFDIVGRNYKNETSVKDKLGAVSYTELAKQLNRISTTETQLLGLELQYYANQPQIP